MTCRHVFTSEAMAACEAKGHTFSWVATLGDYGFDECARCGFTTYVRPKGTPDPIEAAKALRAAKATNVTTGVSTRTECRFTPPTTCRVAFTNEPPVAEPPAAKQQARGRRDAILVLLAGGLSVADVARRVGVTPQHVYQIRARHRAEAET
jgi:DNA-binding NarL/FixJ family response regulator